MKARFKAISKCLLAAEMILFADLQDMGMAFQTVKPQPAHELATRVGMSPLLRDRPLAFPTGMRLRYTQNQQSTKLHAITGLLNDINNKSMQKTTYPRLVFVGGKGGVGKTSISSALAVELASDLVNDHKVLVVSTDPAHSLGDALDVDLRQGNGEPVLLTDPLTGGRLYGCEVNPAAALENFQTNLAEFDVERLAESLGVSPSLLENLGLREFAGLLNNPPPGLDELVALANVLDAPGDYDVVVVDTAPTGHTLRMLALPQFLDGLLGKLIKLRMKLAGITSTLQSLFGDREASQRAQTIDNALDKLEAFKAKIAGLRDRLKDQELTSFAVVTVPTKLGVAESERLIKELTSQGVAVSDVIVNQCLGEIGNTSSVDIITKYYNKRRESQKRWINEIQAVAQEVSASEEYKSNGSSEPIKVTKVPFFDAELVGAPALSYLGNVVYKDNPAFAELIGDGDGPPKFVICGGKGGVGKTTTSASLSVTMANSGHKVAVVSTDPAHSLGDALQMELKGGKLADVPLYGAVEGGSLSAMEVDPSAALKEFKSIVDSLIRTSQISDSEVASFSGTIKDLGEIFDTLPAGTDEVVALAKVINLIKKGGFDRIVLDTAPTGHTLRMLSTPGFIAELIDRVLIISEKVNSNPTIRMFLSGAAKGRDLDAVQESAKATLLDFQMQMYDLEDLFSNSQQTEFVIVTIPTELATRESIRLLNDLTFEAPDMPIKVRNIVVNQVISDDGNDSETFVRRISETQAAAVKQLMRATDALPSPPTITQVSYLDTEPRGVFGLKALAFELMKEHFKEPAQIV